MRQLFIVKNQIHVYLISCRDSALKQLTYFAFVFFFSVSLPLLWETQQRFSLMLSSNLLTVVCLSAGYRCGHHRNTSCDVVKSRPAFQENVTSSGTWWDDVVTEVANVGDISSLLVLPRSVLRAVTVTTRSKSPRDFKPLPPPASSSPLLAAELHHKLQPSANLRNSVNVDLYLWAVLKVYYN